MQPDPRPILLAVQHAQEAERQRQQLAHIVATTPDGEKVTHATQGGDRITLRGIPMQAIGVGGTMLGTNPLTEVLRRG